ncbi:hypothetical protein ACFPOU_22190 [Massilia jejuensis]|uniref:Uncharacterized protein n=1 Tax=Massilia jejuensis TaxID=648894 RepID=A0ABW0PMD6_9BURK
MKRHPAWPILILCHFGSEAVPPRDPTFAAERLSWMNTLDGLPAWPRARAQGG